MGFSLFSGVFAVLMYDGVKKGRNLNLEGILVEKNSQVNTDGEIFSTIGARLRDERKKLKLNQTLLAVQAGVSKETQISYEKGISTPNAAYLVKAARIGVDVLYVVTGQKTQVRQHIITAVEDDQDTVGSRKVVLLDERVQQMLEHYDAADEEGKQVVADTARLAAKVARKK